MNPSRATIPLIRPHQCDSEGGRIRGVLLYIIYIPVRHNNLSGLLKVARMQVVDQIHKIICKLHCNIVA